jgi:transcription antitermination factor NusG
MSKLTYLSPYSMSNTSYSWYALRVKARYEQTIASVLEEKGYATLSPTYSTKRVWSDRVKTVQVPLFAGYLFCAFEAHSRLPIVTTPGVLHILGTEAGPTAVDTAEIAAVTALVRSGLKAQPCPYLMPGQRVYLDAGPLAGVEGVVITQNNRQQLVISITLLQRAVAAEVDPRWVRPIKGSLAKDPIPVSKSADVYRSTPAPKSANGYQVRTAGEWPARIRSGSKY